MDHLRFILADLDRIEKLNREALAKLPPQAGVFVPPVDADGRFVRMPKGRRAAANRELDRLDLEGAIEACGLARSAMERGDWPAAMRYGMEAAYRGRISNESAMARRQLRGSDNSPARQPRIVDPDAVFSAYERRKNKLVTMNAWCIAEAKTGRWKRANGEPYSAEGLRNLLKAGKKKVG